MVVAAVAWMNLPNRVPVLANPQDGISMFSLSSAPPTTPSTRSFMERSSELLEGTADFLSCRGWDGNRNRSEPVRPPRYCFRRYTDPRRPLAVQPCKLNGKISDRGALRGAENNIEARLLARQPVQ